MLKLAGCVVCISVCASPLVGCDATPPTRPERPAHYVVVPPAPAIDAGEARKLVLERYRHLFGNTYWRDHRDGSYQPFPPLELEQFREVRREGDVWVVKCAPPAGYSVRARVAADGSWVDLEHVGYASR
jgi:hypothetical protein